MPLFFSPNIWESPKNFRHRFQAFGMGPEKAKALARKLNLTNPNGPIVVVGTAGALHPQLSGGDCFIVSQLYNSNAKEWIPISSPYPIQFLPSAKTISQDRILARPEEKLALFKETGADIVDCESYYLWDELNDSLRSKLIIVRAVVDRQKDNIDFFEGFHFQWIKLFRPANLYRMIRLSLNTLNYQNEMNSFFSRLMEIMDWDENTEGKAQF